VTEAPQDLPPARQVVAQLFAGSPVTGIGGGGGVGGGGGGGAPAAGTAGTSTGGGARSAKEVVQWFIALADRLSKDGGTNCVVSNDALRTQASRRAAELDDAIRLKAVRRESAPLLGLPISVKECFLIEDTDSTHGLKRYVNQPSTAEEEATLVRLRCSRIPGGVSVCGGVTMCCGGKTGGRLTAPLCAFHHVSWQRVCPCCLNSPHHPFAPSRVQVRMLRNLGAVPFCKTNVPQTMYSWECSNPVYGTTSNPLHRDYVPGGSSGGEACLVAQGGSIVGLGTDIGGSCRIPAHMSGCVGLKATKHRLASRGKGRDVTYGAGQPAIASCTGLLSRSVDDAVFVMEHLCSPDSLSFGCRLDPTLLPIPWRPAVLADKRRLRIAVYDTFEYLEASPACRRAVREAAAALEAAGHELVPFTPPSVRDAMGVFFALLSSGADHLAAEMEGSEVAEALTKLVLQVSE
jgi:Asp-tRNA(Asn)/Glu-tRNA(Gln) amidotransferase A subunit family amidase